MSIANPKAFLPKLEFSNSDQDIESKIFVLSAIKQLTLLRNMPAKIVSLNAVLDYLEKGVKDVSEQ